VVRREEQPQRERSRLELAASHIGVVEGEIGLLGDEIDAAMGNLR
jgi:hypothetical protein